MKKQILGIACTLAIATSLMPTVARGQRMGSTSVPRIMNSVAFPKNASSNNATHRFRLQVNGGSLNQLEIELPDRVEAEGITVTDDSGRQIAANVMMSDRQAIISFDNPLRPNSTLIVDLERVDTPFFSNIWLYPMQARMDGLNADIPIGIARVHTYP